MKKIFFNLSADKQAIKPKTMKPKINLLLILFTAFFFSANAQEAGSAKEMLKDTQKKAELFQAISDDEELREEMMTMLMDKAENDPIACKHLCSVMMNDEHMASAIAEKVLELQEKKEAESLEQRKDRHQTHFHKIKH